MGRVSIFSRARLLGIGIALASNLAAAPASGQPAVPTTSQVAELDSYLGGLARADEPGCAVAAMRGGSIIYEHAWGMADLERGTANAPGTRFLIASTSKQFTAFSIALLVAEGRLSLEDDVRRFVRELPDYGSPITIRHLLWHTSGLREEANLFAMAGWRSSDLETADDVLALISRQRALNFAPGREFQYSNTNYMLLALVVERVSGQPFAQFVAERIFRPLGMNHSEILDDPARIIQGRAIGYWGADGGRFRIARVPYGFAGPTGVVTTVRDLARWEANFYDQQLGGRRVHALMYQPGHLNDGSVIGYAMGVFVGSYRGSNLISHSGSDPGFKAELLRLPEQRLSVAVLCNSFEIAPTPIAHAIADVFIGSSAPTQAPSTPRRVDAARPLPADAASFAGRYWNRETAQVSGFLFEDGKLLVDGGSEGRFELRHIGGGRFLLPVAPRRYVFTFWRTATGERRVRTEIAGDIPREFVAVGPESETPVALSRYAGIYYSAELDADWTVEESDGHLVVRRARYGEEALTPLLPNVFQMNGGFFTLEFSLPDRGLAEGFDVSTERVRRLRFARRD